MKKILAVLLTLGLAIGTFTPVVATSYFGMFEQITVECPEGGTAEACMGGDDSCDEVTKCDGGGGQIGLE